MFAIIVFFFLLIIVSLAFPDLGLTCEPPAIFYSEEGKCIIPENP